MGCQTLLDWSQPDRALCGEGASLISYEKSLKNEGKLNKTWPRKIVAKLCRVNARPAQGLER